MPVVACTRDGKKGYKYGQAGKCYTYNAGDEKGRKKAKQQAYLQGAAIEARTGENELNKYNTCHGDNGRFCGSGGSGGGGGGGGGGGSGGGGGAAAEPAQEYGAQYGTAEERRALADYVGPEFAFMNAYSRHPGGPDAAHYEAKSKKLDSLIAKQPPLKGEEIVYRGMNPPKEVAAQLVKGAVIEDKGFMSTTIDRNTAKNFGGTVMTIRIPKGAKALKVQDFVDTVSSQNEKEMLLPRGTKLQITNVHQVSGGLFGMGKKMSIEARVVE